MPFVFSKTQKLAAFFIIFGTILLIAIFAFIIKGNRTFEKKGYYYTFFEDSKGITVGASIRFKGFNIGKVTKVKLLTDFRTRVDFVIYKEYIQLIRYDTVIKMSSSLLGSSGLTISFIPDQKCLILPNHSEVLSSDMPLGQDILFKISENMPKQDDLTAKASQVIDMILELKPVINLTLLNLRDTSFELKNLASSLNGKGDSETAKKIFDLLNKVNSTMDLLTPTLANFKDVSVDAKNITTKLNSDLPKILSDLSIIEARIDKLLNGLDNLPEDIKELLELAKQNLIQLKYVLENIPLVPKNTSSSTSIQTQGR
ncbi:MAG TPA: MlaD family protein [Exilispira sp.]|nr:MlaD family protein [Exilispira sp.]